MTNKKAYHIFHNRCCFESFSGIISHIKLCLCLSQELSFVKDLLNFVEEARVSSPQYPHPSQPWDEGILFKFRLHCSVALCYNSLRPQFPPLYANQSQGHFLQVRLERHCSFNTFKHGYESGNYQVR